MERQHRRKPPESPRQTQQLLWCIFFPTTVTRGRGEILSCSFILPVSTKKNLDGLIFLWDPRMQTGLDPSMSAIPEAIGPGPDIVMT